MTFFQPTLPSQLCQRKSGAKEKKNDNFGAIDTNLNFYYPY